MSELSALIAAVEIAEAKCDAIGASDLTLYDAAAHEAIAAKMRLRAYLCAERGQALQEDPRLDDVVEMLAQDVHRTWHDQMLLQDRKVSPERQEWSTLPDRDKDIDRAIARSMLWHIAGVEYPQHPDPVSEEA